METKMKWGNIGVYIGMRQREKRSEKRNEYWNDIGDSVGKDFGLRIVTIILNSPENTSALLDSKNAPSSDCLSMYFAGNMVGWDKIFTMLRNGPRLKTTRRLVAQEIGSRAEITRFVPQIEAQTYAFILKVLDNPSAEMLPQYICNLSSGEVLSIAYGYDIKSDQDNVVDLANRAIYDLSLAVAPGAHIVDTFPWLDRLPSWFPGTGFKTEAAMMRQTLQDFVNVPFNIALDQIAAGTARPSLVLSRLEEIEGSPEEIDVLKWAAASLYGGGADTTPSLFYTFLILMALHPEIQERAQKEVDAIVDTERRLPTIEDCSKLKYVDAVVKEVFCCGEVIPLASPCQLETSYIHKGYLLPKGSIILGNIGFLLRDPCTYKDPYVFNPERFLGDNPEPDPRAFVFGFGRRVCPGKVFAETTLFFACVAALAALTISKALDVNGKEITPQIEFCGAMISRPKVVPLDIKTCSARAETLVRAASHM